MKTLSAKTKISGFTQIKLITPLVLLLFVLSAFAQTTKPLVFTEAGFITSNSPSSTNQRFPTWEETSPLPNEKPDISSHIILNKTGIILAVVATVLLLIALVACIIFTRRFVKSMGATKFIILFGAIGFVLCGLFPPWLSVSTEGHTRTAGYNFILTPPTLHIYGTRLDISRLTVEWLCIVVVTGTALLLVSKPEKKTESKDT